MSIHRFVVFFSILISGTTVALGASPKGADSGVLTRLDAIQATSDEAVRTSEYGSVRTLPSVQPDALLVAAADDGVRYTMLRYSSPGSAGVRLHLQNVRLSNDARIYVYGLSSEGAVVDVQGPYVGAGPVQSGEFWTPVIHASDAVVEVQFDRDVPADLPFEVAELGALDADQVAGASAVSPTFDSGLNAELRRSVYKGVVIDHQVRDGMAVFEGDIILGPADELKPVSALSTKTSVREGTMATWSSAKWPNGIMPYVIDPALPNAWRVTDAINHWNTMLAGVVQLVPRTNQSNYVYFAYTSNASYCASTVGMSVGAQYTWLGDYCGTGNIIHEIGHDFGLWHEHTRNDRDKNVTIMTQNIDPSALGNFTLTGSSGYDVGIYDFNSVMHYPAYAFSANGQPTIVTIPSGIPIGQRNGLSSGDIASITQIYGSTKVVQTVSESVTSNPAGLQLQVDGATVVAPYAAQWTAGSSHTVNAPNPAPANGQKFVFSSWSDGGAQSHSVSATATVLTANYAVSYLLTKQASPAAGGTVAVTPTSTDGYYPAGSTVTLSATPAAGYCFSSWTGLLSGTPAQTSLTMTKAYSLTANFVACAPPPSTAAVFAPIRVRAGASTSYTDSNGNTWAPDAGFTNGYTYGGWAPVANTASPGVYSAERYNFGTLQYMFIVPNGTFTLNLKFAEIYYSTCGQRVFNIAVNGIVRETNFDPCAAAGGSFRAVDRSYSVNVTGGQIAIQLIPVVSNPKISGIEILSTSLSNVSTAFTPIRVNAGGPSITDSLGQTWAGDTNFLTGGVFGYGAPIANTTTPGIYQSERYSFGTLSYVFPAPTGTYTVTLKFAEIYYSTCGQRVFNIVINGQTVETNFDPCAAAGGSLIAVDRQFTVSPTSGSIRIDLVPVISNPKISAIEIR